VSKFHSLKPGHKLPHPATPPKRDGVARPSCGGSRLDCRRCSNWLPLEIPLKFQ
jgi:hypothetical protein